MGKLLVVPEVDVEMFEVVSGVEKKDDGVIEDIVVVLGFVASDS